MFDKDIDTRLSHWYEFRITLDSDADCLESVVDFWNQAPFIPFNHKIDKFDRPNWPTPWEIIVYNKYDDFTKALMIGWTLKLTNKFKNSVIELKTVIDTATNKHYNIICIDNEWVLNFLDNQPILINDLPNTIFIEYSIELSNNR